MLFQIVPETTKNRLHLDVRPSGPMASEVARMEQLGATAITGVDEGTLWTVDAIPRATSSGCSRPLVGF